MRVNLGREWMMKIMKKNAQEKKNMSVSAGFSYLYTGFSGGVLQTC